MKYALFLLTLLILTGCGQSNLNKLSNKEDTLTRKVPGTTIIESNNSTNQNPPLENQTEDFRKQALCEYEKATLYKLTDTIMADLNGDGFTDKAFYLKEEEETSGIIIKHGNTNEVIKIGFGKLLDHLTDFNWVDYWGLIEDKETYETIFPEDGEIMDSRVIQLQNPSILLVKDEVGGGLVTFRNGKYEWIHQSD